MPNPSNSPDFFSQHPIWTDAICFVAGLLLVFSFSPFYIFPLAIISPAILFYIWVYSKPGRSFWRGLLFGLGLFGGGVSWVFVSVYQFGNMTWPLAVLIVLVFILVLSLFPAMLGWLQARFFAGRIVIRCVLLMPAMWTLGEWVRSWLMSGFPWLNLGYSQTPGPLIHWAAWWGVYGVSYMTALTAALLVWLLIRKQAVVWFTLPVILLLWIVGFLVQDIGWTRAVGVPVDIGLVQGNFSIREKWNPDNRDKMFRRYIALSEKVRRAQVIIWPEAALPYDLSELKPHQLKLLQAESRNYQSEFIIGVVEKETVSGRLNYYNSAFTVGGKPQVYRKRHLVPFGEYIPLRLVFDWLMRSIHIPMSDFSRGLESQEPLSLAGQYFGISICYEDAFGGELIQVLPKATILVNLSEDAWFGRSLAPHQRLQMARVRAIESGRDMIRVGNTGITARINHRGQIPAGQQAPQFQVHAMVVQAQPRQGLTPYARLGNWPILLFCAFILVLSLLLTRRYGQRRIASGS